MLDDHHDDPRFEEMYVLQSFGYDSEASAKIAIKEFLEDNYFLTETLTVSKPVIYQDKEGQWGFIIEANNTW